jgi:hypothetical protein
MTERTIDEIKQQLISGWQGIFYVRTRGFFSSLSGRIYDEFQGTVVDVYKEGHPTIEGIIIENSQGKKVRIPYDRIANFEPFKTADKIREKLAIGSKGDLYLKKGKISDSIVTGIYDGDIVLNQPRFRGNRMENNFRIVQISDIVNVHFPGQVVVHETDKNESDNYYQIEKGLKKDN